METTHLLLNYNPSHPTNYYHNFHRQPGPKDLLNLPPISQGIRKAKNNTNNKETASHFQVLSSSQFHPLKPQHTHMK